MRGAVQAGEAQAGTTAGWFSRRRRPGQNSSHTEPDEPESEGSAGNGGFGGSPMKGLGAVEHNTGDDIDIVNTFVYCWPTADQQP